MRAQHKIYSLSFLMLLGGGHFVVGEFFFQRILDFFILRVAQAMKRGETSRASHLLGGYGRLPLGPRGHIWCCWMHVCILSFFSFLFFFLFHVMCLYFFFLVVFLVVFLFFFVFVLMQV